MKTKILLLLSILVLITSIGFTATLTVSNDPSGGAQYNTIQAARDASVNGDTIVIEGTDIPYSMGQSLDKSLVYIGIGFNPDKQNPRRTLIYQAANFWYDNRIDFNSGSSGSKFYGIEFTEFVRLITTINDLLFEDCKFTDYFSYNFNASNNTAFINCIFTGTSGGNIRIDGSGNVVSGVIIMNSIFNTYIEGNSNPFVEMVISNCLFLSTTTASFNNLQSATITNNIFMNYFPGGTTNSTYLNNLCRVAGTFPPAGTGNTGSGNIENTDPDFVNYTLNDLYSATHDYNLQPGSVAIGAGSSGIDIGVHGGSSGFSEFGEVLINPIVRSVTIQNPLVEPNGTLQVDIHASTPHNN